MNFNDNLYGLATFVSDSLAYNYNVPPIYHFVDFSLFNDTIFIGGDFKNIGYVPAKNVAKFVDGSFSSVASIGTKWWYNSSDNGAGTTNSAYTYYEVTRDTFIMHTANYYGYNCRKIKQEQHSHDSSVTVMPALYVFGDTTRVMYYNNYQGRFVPLYKFNVTTGDTLTYYTPQPQTASDTTFRVVVDSVTLLNIQGTNYKRIWSTPLDNWSFGNDGYVQLVGGMGSMLPQPTNYFNTEGPLRCYQDTSVFYQYIVNLSCEQLDTATGIEQLIIDNGELRIYPNPAGNQLTVSSWQLAINTIEITDLVGRVVLKQSVTPATKNVELNISELSRGVYFIKVFSAQGTVTVKKVVKE